MKYQIGDKVRIMSLDWYNKNKDEFGVISCGKQRFTPNMSWYCGKTLIISCIIELKGCYGMLDAYYWTDEMIECKVEEVGLVDKLSSRWVNEFNLPEGYIFKDENGNVINATKIVLEKKKKDANLTQEQINKMVHDSCALFCKHCGCGIPRDTCISLGTCNDHDEYRTAIRTYLMNKHKD